MMMIDEDAETVLDPETARWADLIPQMRRLRMSGRVKRWHTVPIHGEQTVAEHCAQAMSLLLLIHPNPSINLVKCVLWHDSEELILGDMPANGKNAYPAVREAMANAEVSARHQTPEYRRARDALSREDELWIKFVDVLEFLMFAADQLALGNTHASTWIDRGIEYVSVMKLPREAASFWDAMLIFIHEPVRVL
jgi:5'-deoxynucleotidase YfbR-like HD superfamily hydrolase